jgi:epoxyqueuosine reductase
LDNHHATTNQAVGAELRERLQRRSRGEGFSHFGVTAAIDSPGFAQLSEWIEAGYAGGMDYFAERLEAYRHPRGVLEGVRSLVLLAYPYAGAPAPPVAFGQGRVARYVWSGDDYHDTIHARLKRLVVFLREECGATAARGVVDTAPLMEREWAELAGLGWRGKNTLLLNKWTGSYFFLACLLTDLQLPPDAPVVTDHCGTCRRCLEACPTDAFPQEGVLDASRCISYLTIEHRGAIPQDLRSGLGDWLFGCDICQEVCPWNQKQWRRSQRNVAAQGDDPTAEADPLQRWDRLELTELFDLDDDAFRARFRKTPLWRPRRRGLLRNAAIVLGNQRDGASLPALRRGLNDSEPLVRGAAAWAVGQIGGETALAALESALDREADAKVCREIQQALSSLRGEGGAGNHAGV